MVTPVVHMGLGWDDLLVPALVEAGFATRDMVLVARTEANLGWARRHAPGAQVVRLPYARARRHNVISGLGVHRRLGAAAAAVGLDPLDLLLCERAVRRNRTDLGMNFLNHTADELDDVLSSVGPALTLAEFTVSSELILAGLTEVHGGLALWPRSMRLPADRFGLFGTPRGIEHWHRTTPDPDAPAIGRAFLEEWHQRKSRPAGYQRNLKVETPAEVAKMASARVKEIVLDRGRNLQLPRPMDYWRLPWLNPLRGRRNLAIYKNREWAPTPPDGPYAFYPLHVQPESSVDVWAPPWRDQSYAACRMADALATQGVALVVKEHAHFMWRRDPDFWTDIDAHPNIVTLDPHADSREVSQGAVFSFTATGTVGLEGALQGLRVVSGARMPWTVLGNVAHVPTPDAVAPFVARRGWEDLREDPDRITQWYADEYLPHSWPGVALDPPRAPQVLEKDNIASFGRAFAEAAASVPDRAPAVAPAAAGADPSAADAGA
jgi:hypothetical protein